MEVAMTEEKKKIFRARKTMKISDRQQLETLHSTLLTSPSGLSNSPPPPLMNGTHKEDGQKPGDKEQVDLETKSPNATTPTSPAPFLSLNLSPSPASSDGLKTKEEPLASPGSPFHSLNSELKKLENSDNMGSSSPTSNVDIPAPNKTDKVQESSDEPVAEGKRVENETKEDPASVNSVKDTENMVSPVEPANCSEPMETDSQTCKPVDAVLNVDTTEKDTDKKASSPKSSTVASPSPAPAATVTELEDRKEEIKEEKTTAEELKKEPVKERKNIEVKKEIKKEKNKTTKQSRPSSTPPSSTVKEEKSSTSGLKRTLSEGFDPNDCSLNRDVKKRKMEGEEFEAQLELKITAKAGSHRKLEKIVQKLLEEKLRVLELTIFDKNLQDLKDRVDLIECATKHQTAINTLQVKLARLAKKFGEANQASENKKKQEALAAAAAAAAAVAAAANAATTNTSPAAVAPPAKTISNSPQTKRPGRTTVEVKQTTAQSTSSSAPGSSSASSVSVPVSSNTSLVPQTPILQLIASTSNAVSNLTASTTQSSPGTLLLKTTPGSGVMASGQPLLIQLPLSMANGQTGTLVNIPVSTLNAATLNKTKTTAPTTTFILKSAPTSTSASSLTTVSALTAPASQVPTTQISLARAVYQGGAGGITTPNAGISMTTARAATQAVSVVGALSSASSPVTSGPAATGSTAPGAPQGTSLATKTDNQTTSTPSKVPAPGARPKGSVIDLTEEDDDVLVTGVKSATTPNATRPQTSIPSAARSSPQSNQNSTSNLQLSAHHRPPLDLASKSRTTSNSTPTRASSVSLPPLPVAPVPPRLPPEAEKTSPPQQPQLKLVPSHTGIVLSWCVAETDTTCAAVDCYHLYAFHQDNSNSNPSQQHWKKIGEVKALPLPMACTLTQFQSGSTYHFAVRAKDIYGRFGAFCEPQCTNVISSSSS